ncbi:MAG: hypothetical protein SF053_09435 [Bacteroidia bacterium]|nr:hypothetical protein [Bacteroidia bacterium]
MYAALIKEKFPQDEKNGLYVSPQLPAVKLGKILIKDTRVTSPNDVLALHLNEGPFSTSVIMLTKDRCYYAGGAFLLEDVREVQAQGSKVIVFANQKGQFVPNTLPVKNEQVAQTLRRVFENIANKDLQAEEMLKKTYEGYSDTELSWLNLRDEIMRTIDMLYDRYNDGKLSLIEYEEKKEELLSRL